MRGKRGHHFPYLILLVCGAMASAADVVPYDLAISVEWSQNTAGTSARDTLRGELVASELRKCFRSVRPRDPAVPPAADLLWLHLQVEEYHEELELAHGVGQDTSSQPDGQGLAVAHVTSRALAEVRTADGLPLRQRTIRTSASWRPIAGEDPREEAHARWIESIVRSTRSFACKGSERTWSTQIEEARRGDRSR
jgi:hypothetical protein